MKKTLFRVPLCLCAALFLIFAAISAAFAFKATRTVLTEPGEEAVFPFPVGSPVCPIETDLSTLNTDLTGEWSFSCRLWGIFPLTGKIEVADRELSCPAVDVISMPFPVASHSVIRQLPHMPTTYPCRINLHGMLQSIQLYEMLHDAFGSR